MHISLLTSFKKMNFFAVFKKMVGARRELSAQASTDSARCGRKQRNSIKKRQSSVADYLSMF